MMTKQDLLENESVTMTKTGDPKMEVSLEVGCLPYAVGKHPSIPVIICGRKWTLR